MNTKPALCLAITPAVQRTLQFEVLRPGEVNRARSLRVSPAGKGVNVARVLNTLGVEVVVAGFSGGPGGAHLVAMLDELGIHHDFIQTQAPTRTCTTVVEGSGCVTELVEEAPLPQVDEWAKLRSHVETNLPAAGLLILAGALPPGADPLFYRDLVRCAADAGVPVLVDARGTTLTGTLACKPLLAKLNRHELAETGLDAKALVAGGASWALVTAGPDALELTGHQGGWRYTPPVIRACNPIGSGESVTAGIAASLLQGKAMPEAVQFGVACGTANALTWTPGELEPDTVRELLPHVEVTGPS